MLVVINVLELTMKSLFLAGVGLLIAAGVLVVWTVVSLNSAASFVDLNRVPGTFTVKAAESGRYFLWDAEKTRFEGELFEAAGAFPEDSTVSITDSDGNLLKFVSEEGDGVSVGNNRHRNVGYVDVTNPATLTVDIAVGDGAQRDGAQRVVSMGIGKQMHLLGGLMFRGITAGACLVLGLLFTLIGFVGGALRKTGRQRERLPQST